jgi:hypothetical protein
MGEKTKFKRKNILHTHNNKGKYKTIVNVYFSIKSMRKINDEKKPHQFWKQ